MKNLKQLNRKAAKLERGKREVDIFQITDLTAKIFDALYAEPPHRQYALIGRGLQLAARRAKRKKSRKDAIVSLSKLIKGR